MEVKICYNRRQFCNNPTIGQSSYCESCYEDRIVEWAEKVCLDPDGDCYLSTCYCDQTASIEKYRKELLEARCQTCDVLLDHSDLPRYASCPKCHDDYAKMFDAACVAHKSTPVPKTKRFGGKIYRIEKDGRGPYRGGALENAPKELEVSNMIASSLMNPPEDYKIYDYDGVYGFSSMAALKHYIKDDLLAYLISKGYSVNEYVVGRDVEHYKLFDSKLQVVFKKKTGNTAASL